MDYSAQCQPRLGRLTGYLPRLNSTGRRRAESFIALSGKLAGFRYESERTPTIVTHAFNGHGGGVIGQQLVVYGVGLRIVVAGDACTVRIAKPPVESIDK